MCTVACMWSQRTTFRSGFSPPTMWVLGIKLRHQAWQQAPYLLSHLGDPWYFWPKLSLNSSHLQPWLISICWELIFNLWSISHLTSLWFSTKEIISHILHDSWLLQSLVCWNQSWVIFVKSFPKAHDFRDISVLPSTCTSVPTAFFWNLKSCNKLSNGSHCIDSL